MPEEPTNNETEPTLPPPPKAIEVSVFLNDPRKMPCFRTAMIFGFYGAFTATIAARLYNKTWRHADRYGMGALLLVSMARWHTCRYSYNEKRENIRGIVAAMEAKQQQLAENQPPSSDK